MARPATGATTPTHWSILSGDNGIPGIPRGKTNCYDLSIRAPMLLRWPERIAAGRRVDDFVSVMDIGPTLLEATGLPVPKDMDGLSFMNEYRSRVLTLPLGIGLYKSSRDATCAMCLKVR